MRLLAAASILLLVSAFPTHSLAPAEGDILGQCLEDNADEGQTTDAVATYCSCEGSRLGQPAGLT
jgi:hypothetical protein